jgi:hypothetical protein
MKKFLYIGHSFHQKTRSTEFFIEILKNHFDIEFLWTLPRLATMEIKNSGVLFKDYDAIIMFQILPHVNELKQFKCQNITLIPMYDNDLDKTYSQWSKYYEYKFINFSKSLYNKLNFLGIKKNLYLQYAPEIPLFQSKNSNKSKVDIFFWQRSKSLNWDLIRQIINPDQVNSVHIHRIDADETKDLWFQKPDDKDIKKYNMTFSSWFENKNELMDKIRNCDVFIQPRYNEGIGQAFIEAMSYGKCVISPDLPTMNEYIENGVNGILYNPKDLTKLNLSNHASLGAEAKKTIANIRTIWEDKKENILEFILIENINPKQDFTQIKKYENILTNDLDFFLDDAKALIGVEPKSLTFSKQLNLLNGVLSSIKDNNVILYGSGTGANLILGFIPDKIEYIVDIDKKKHGKKFMNKTIFPIEKLCESNKKILISVFGRSFEIINFLQKNGIDTSRTITLDLS